MGNYQTGIESKEKILAAARKLFYEKGFKKTTLAEISRVSGANKAMVSYYFGNKDHLGLEIYHEYMVAMKVKTQRLISELKPDCDPLYRTAIELRLQNRNCRMNPNLGRFYHEMCESNIFFKTESAAVGFIENINRSLKMDLNRLEVKTLSLANLSIVHGLHIAWAAGFIDCSSEYLAETEIRMLFQTLEIPADTIRQILEESRDLAEKINIRVGKNFKVED